MLYQLTPYLDAEISLSSRNRKLRTLTLREFIIKKTQGMTMRAMRDEGLSRHLLQFLSNFAQGKIDLDEEMFKQEYWSGMTLLEIAAKHGITAEDIGFLRQLYGIRAKGPTFQRRKRTEAKLTPRQRELIYGSLMGDAKMMSPSSVGFGHGTNQQDYLMWKYNELRNLCSEESLRIRKYTDRRSGSLLVDGRFYTKANTEVEEILGQFYETGKREVSEEILDNLTPFSVAVWYMDDGCADMKLRQISKGINARPSFMFCTDSFSYSSCQLIQHWFKEKWNIDTIARKQRDIGHRIVVRTSSSKEFANIVQQHMLPMFQYKIVMKA